MFLIEVTGIVIIVISNTLLIVEVLLWATFALLCLLWRVNTLDLCSQVIDEENKFIGFSFGVMWS